MGEEKSKNIHANHRQRVRNRFIKEGNLENFEEYQVLELILFYSIPRRDTNALAHQMIETYGSLYNLLNASPKDIMTKCNVSDTTAVLLSMLPHVFRKHLNSKFQTGGTIKTPNTAKKYCESLLAGLAFECFYCIFLDSRYRLIRHLKMSEGSKSHAHIDLDKIVNAASAYNAEYVIVCHNHPNNTYEASSADVSITKRIALGLKCINVTLIDHIIVCDDKSLSFSENEYCGLKYYKD